jgi:hypothetical protein
MAELGISGGPKIIDPDYGLAEIMTQINKQSSPYADANAFLKSKEPIEALQELSLMQQKAQSYFKASGALKGKVINFDSIRSQTVEEIDPVTKREGKVVARLPQNKGMVTMGFHLPIENSLNSTDTHSRSTSDQNSTKTHTQIPQLPPRFRYPFFTYKGIQSNYQLENYSFQYSSARQDIGAPAKSATEGIAAAAALLGASIAGGARISQGLSFWQRRW